MGKRQHIMQCQPMTESNWKKMSQAKTVFIQPKLDGVRCRVVWNEVGKPLLVSSEGNLFYGVPHIEYELLRLTKLHGMALDGEFYNNTLSFEEIVSIVSRESEERLHENYNRVEYHVFDYQDSTVNLSTRLNVLSHVLPMQDSCIRRVYTREVSPLLWKDYCSQFVEEGYEGIVIKHPDYPYYYGRPWYIIKYKPMKTDIYAIHEVCEALSIKDKTPLGRLGSIVCRDRYGNLFSVGIGKGFSIKQREDLWNTKEQWWNKNAVVEYQNLTDNYIPRFGRVVQFTDEEEVHV